GVGAERLPEEDVGVVVRRHALAQALVKGGRVVDGAVLADRAADVGRRLADREPGLALLLALVAWHWRFQGGKLAPTNQQTETQQEQTGSERAHDAGPPRGEVRERTWSSAFRLPGEPPAEEGKTRGIPSDGRFGVRRKVSEATPAGDQRLTALGSGASFST